MGGCERTRVLLVWLLTTHGMGGRERSRQQSTGYWRNLAERPQECARVGQKLTTGPSEDGSRYWAKVDDGVGGGCSCLSSDAALGQGNGAKRGYADAVPHTVQMQTNRRRRGRRKMTA
jgi:hypothetical protein